MKKIYLFILACFLLYIGCTEDETTDIEVINTDISVTASESLIFWLDQDDLTQQINEAFTFNHGNALENEIRKTITYNTDSTEVSANIEFKQAFQEKYHDGNITNNTATVFLQKESDIMIDEEILSALTSDQVCELLQVLINDLPNYNSSNQSNICIPITFHIPSGITINTTILDNTINNLNLNFIDSKILFSLNSVNTTSNNEFYNLNLDTVNFPDVINNLNIYVAHTIVNNNTQANFTINGKAHFPTEAIDRVYIRDVFFDPNRDEKSAVLSHEIGHFFSLFHTFERATDNNNCNTNGSIIGDGIDDTPVDLFGLPLHSNASIHYGLLCNAINSDISLLIDNFMSYSMNSYTLRNCDRMFTNLQHERMGFSVRHWKTHLICENSSTNSSNIELSGNLNFGEIEINTSSTRQLTIANTGNESFNITNINIPNGYTINGTSTSISGNSEVIYNVTFTPTQIQNYNGNIIVENNADTGTNTIAVTGIGVNNNSGGEPNIIYQAYQIDDDTSGGSDGNGNGIAEAGEDIELKVQLQNTGSDTATNVSAVLSTNDPDITITDANETYGTINAGDSDWNTDFDFEINPNCPTKTVTFTLNISSNEGNWTETFSIQIQGNSGGQPNIIYQAYQIDDDTSGGSDGNDNGIAEAGEDIELKVQLQNTGSDTATGVSAVLSTNDPDITITDANETYGTINAGDSDWNTDFDFDINPNCPTKTVYFTLNISSNEGNWTETFSIQVQGQNGGGLPQEYAVNSPRDNCAATGVSDSYRLDLNINYYRDNWNIDNIISYGTDGKRGMWYRFRTTTTGTYTINLTMNGNPGFELFTACGASSVAISDNSNSNTETGTYTINSPNTDIYIRFYDNDDNSNVDFDISIEH